MKPNQVSYLCLIISLFALSNAILLVSQPKTNVWVTLANASGLDTICLTYSSPEKPFSTCLLSLPVESWPVPKNVSSDLSRFLMNPTEEWGVWTKVLPETPYEPQELEILGSVRMAFCITFDPPESKQNTNKNTDVTPNHALYKNATSWCNFTVLHAAPNHVPLQLPQGDFFIFGDRVWPAIPPNPKGGPCSIGRLTLLTPNVKMIKEHKHREKRFVDQYTPDCDDHFKAWDFGRRFPAALFSPQVASRVSLKQLDQLGCWLSKNSRAISLALSNMLTDVQSVRHTTLQNRAAIDYVLLVHGNETKDFEGMCCMNLSDHSVSIHKSIQELEEGITKLRVERRSWLDDLFDWLSLAPLWREILRVGMYVLIVIVVAMALVPCLLQCIRQWPNKAVKAVFMVQTGGGDVGTLDSENYVLSLLTSSDLQKHTPFDLRPWEKLPRLCDSTEVVAV